MRVPSAAGRFAAAVRLAPRPSRRRSPFVARSATPRCARPISSAARSESPAASDLCYKSGVSAGRFAVLTVGLLALPATAGIGALQEPGRATSCAAALVRYDSNRHAQGAPWIVAGPGRSRLEGYLYRYREYLGDGRVNRSETVVLRAGVEEKIGWFSKRWGGSRLHISGRRIDGSGSFSRRFRAMPGAGFYPSGILIPAAGCWQLTLRTEGWVRRLVIEAVVPAPTGTCDATPGDETGSVVLTPRRSGIAAGLGWRTPEGGALLYTGGRTPDGGNTKVLWRWTRDVSVFTGGELVLHATQLDGPGAFTQRLRQVTPTGYWPSIVVVPNPGCWLLTARIGGQPGAAGIFVARVVTPSG